MKRISLKQFAMAFLLVCFGQAFSQQAHAITGTISGTLYERLLLSSCDDSYDYPDFKLYLKTGQKFSLTSNGRTFTGTFTKNAAQTSLVFTLDAASKSRLAGVLGRSASSLCGATVSVSSFSAPIFRASLAYGASKSSTCNISGSMSVSATGRTAFGAGSAKYLVNIYSACFTGRP